MFTVHQSIAAADGDMVSVCQLYSLSHFEDCLELLIACNGKGSLSEWFPTLATDVFPVSSSPSAALLKIRTSKRPGIVT